MYQKKMYDLFKEYDLNLKWMHLERKGERMALVVTKGFKVNILTKFSWFVSLNDLGTSENFAFITSLLKILHLSLVYVKIA